MQNKGLIKGFAIAFAIACLYQLTFTFTASRIERKAREYARGDREAEQRYLDSMASEKVLNLLIRKYTYAEVKQKELNLGLDLKGGMNVILEVQVRDIIRSLAGDKNNPLILEALDNTDKKLRSTQDNYANLFFTELDALMKAKGLSLRYSDPTLFGTKMLNDRVGFNAPDEKIKEEIRREVQGAIDNVFTVLRARIDQFGVVQPNIQKLENSGRILIELPGVKEPERVKKLLQSTAQLEFWNLYEGSEFLDFLSQANERLRVLVPRDKESTTIDEKKDQKASDILNIKSVDDEQTTAQAEQTRTTTDTAKAESDTSVVENQYNPLFEVLAPYYDFQNNRAVPGPIVGIALVKDTAKVNKYLSMPQIRALLPADKRYVKFLWSAKPEGSSQQLFLLAIKGNRDDRPDLSGDVVIDARQDFDERNRPIVTMTMNAVGAQKWQKITREAASQDPKRSVAVVLDNLVYSFPQVQNEIPGGRTQITGNFTIQEAQDLANILKAGKLAAPARIVQADVVGPSLGKESIRAGIWSFVIALVIVLIYMIFYYQNAGVAANVALVVNMFFIFGLLASLGAVLTLPGIAGIVLTIGMSVDANVIIYERIREELRAGKGLKLAISDGYKAAYSSIIDANVTTLLTGIILYVFGTGPIRGFATTLIIGIFTSLFCAIFITRLIFEARLEKKKSITFSSKFTEGIFTNSKIDFLALRKRAYFISGAIIVAGIISLFTRGLDYGVDFVGGRSYQIRFDQPVNTVKLATAIGEYFIDESGKKIVPTVKTIGSANQVIVTTKYKINQTGLEVENEIKGKLYQACKPFYATEVPESQFLDNDSGIGIVAERQVGPTIADDIKESAIWALVFSLLVIFLYILVRFSRWQFSLGAVLAAFHDVLVVISLFSLLYGIVPFTLEIDQAFIAALLTVIGYSLNDTVIVFDRIREYFATHSRRKPINEVINEAVNNTLGRTINTSLTTLFVLVIIFIFGGEVIRGFMFALMMGVIVGTYSSLFIATPVVYDTFSEEDRIKLQEAHKAANV
ncbi:MAG: protein translocase subunit SecDF [Thermaurantimonas sp.]|uniref:protein translocase subunit SecDF n=1 Tax=Thermaurantimonas sp. TaxID=2681568 RepID=UPI00391D89AB